MVSPSQCRCLNICPRSAFCLPYPGHAVANRHRALIHSYMGAHERVSQINANSRRTLSRSPSDDPALREGVRPSPAHLTHLINDLRLCSGDLIRGSDVNIQLCDRSRVLGSQRSNQAAEELPVVSRNTTGKCLAISKSKVRATQQCGMAVK